MAREAGSRLSSLFPFGSNDRSRSKSPGPNRTGKARGSSPNSQSRSSNAKSKSNANGSGGGFLRPSSSHQSLSSLRDASSSYLPRNASQPRLSALMADDAPQSSQDPGAQVGDDLMPPPPIAGFGGMHIGGSGGNSPGAGSTDGGSKRSSIFGRPGSSAGSRPASRAGSPVLELPNSRPGTPGADAGGMGGKLMKRASWMPGGKHVRTASKAAPAQPGTGWAFVVGPTGKSPYDTTALIKSQPVSEIWDEHGNMFVHFTDKATSKGPSFKIHASMIAQSKKLTGHSIISSVENTATHARNVSTGSQPMSRSSSGGSDSDHTTPVLEEQQDGLHLYLQLANLTTDKGEISLDGLDRMLKIRNLFAFLVGQVLVGNSYMSTMFAILMTIAKTLRSYEFTNMDGTNLGEAATASFLGYVEDLQLADVRTSREKTLEAIALGERMKCWPLYNEGYAHAVGKYDDIMHLKSPVFLAITETTKTRLEKSNRDLQIRLTATCARLEKFDFPALFHGVLASSAVSKLIDAKAWKGSFLTMRNHVISVYKARYGQWPPKAKSNKNSFETSGINRMVAIEMYEDFCDLYDMLVDRTNLTPRAIDISVDQEEGLSGDPAIQTLRKFMSEYDRSSPPVLPPIPYDLPLLPDLGEVRRDFKLLNLRKQVKERSKKVRDDEINNALMKSYNRDAVKVTPFLESFMAFERRSASGKTFDEIVDLRIGQWIFLYVVLQSLPLLAMDAPGLRWTKDAEYFLCESPRGSPPWVQGEETNKKSYYRVASSGTGGGAGAIVSLPPDVVENGIEAHFFRSHCWTKAQEWNSAQGRARAEADAQAGYAPPLHQEQPYGQAQQYPGDPQAYQQQQPFGTDRTHAGDSPPPSAHPNPIYPQNSSNGDKFGSAVNHDRKTSLGLGLEALPLPPPIGGSADDKAMRRLSTPDPTKSFDAILGVGGTGVEGAVGGKKKKR